LKLFRLFLVFRCFALGSIPLHGMPSCEGIFYPF
jgi:hypothetical protein